MSLLNLISTCKILSSILHFHCSHLSLIFLKCSKIQLRCTLTLVKMRLKRNLVLTQLGITNETRNSYGTRCMKYMSAT